jgi:alpha-glucosidase
MPWDGARECGFTTGIPWLPLDPRHRALSVADQTDDPASPLALVRRLTALRRSLPGFATSDLKWVDTDAPLLAFERRGNGWQLRCAFNMSADQVVTLPAGFGGDVLEPREYVIRN